MEIEREGGAITFLNKWDFHELAHAHDAFGRIFVCAGGRVVAWYDDDAQEEKKRKSDPLGNGPL
ncbi:MAG: hypothetical protein IKI35_08390 [Stomatobaculum sp.]|nr:hypothetical protein [Stomatobaculum sp.]